MTDIEMRHKKEYGQSPEVIYSCPGKITISGEHTEYNDGVILSTTVNLFCHVSASKRSDNSIRVYSDFYNERKKSSITNLKFKKEDKWFNYIKGVIVSILQTSENIGGMDLTVVTEIPQGIGLGSSSAMCLAAACCIKNLFKIDLSWLNIIESVRFSKTVFMNLYSGLDDAMTQFFCKKDSLFYLDASTLEFENIACSDILSKLVLLDPGVVNNEIEYDFVGDREGIYDLVTSLSKGKNSHSLRNYRVVDIRNCFNINERIKRKAIFIVEEIKRTTEIKRVLESGDFNLLGRYLIRSHEGLRDLFESTCPEVDWLIKRCIETDGVFGGKASGEIPCGIVIFIMDHKGMENFKVHLEDYEKIFGFNSKNLDFESVDGMSVKYSELSLNELN